jgi:hypothetical protein
MKAQLLNKLIWGSVGGLVTTIFDHLAWFDASRLKWSIQI